MRALDADASWVKRRAAMGWLVPVFRGVYAIGHPPRTRRGWYRAALLAGGERSVLSHLTAASSHRLADSAGPLHLTVPTSPRGPEGLRIPRPSRLRAEDRVIVDGCGSRRP